MKTDRKVSIGPAVERDDISARRRHRRVDSIDQPARPLGEKRAALHHRRKRRSPSSVRSTSGHSNTCTLRSQDGSITFTLQSTTEGLLIDRTQKQIIGNRLTQSLVFADQPAFDRWCSAEPLRFEDAVLFGQLVREGHGAFSPPR